MSGLPRRAGLALCLLFAAACDRGEAPVPNEGVTAELPVTRVSFPSDTAWVISDTDSVTLHVELATTSEQQSFGLMDRDPLARYAGMIFLYDTPQPPDGAFYMYRTRVPLDIAFFDGSGRIVSILQMTPCTSPQPHQCPLYSPGQPYLGALEVNRGWLQEHGIEVGDRVLLPGRLGG